MILSAVSSIEISKDAAFIPCLKPKARQGMNSLANSKSPLQRTNEFFSPLQRTLALRQGLKPLPDCRTAGLPDCRTAGLPDCRTAGLPD
ncbi:hypothetical protein QUB56_07500 [Microcoleus sp. AR_TQ3_B6]|uniref:hypothetical protein n=1 Tax=Microcoleus sp. AR_TQ3_B6 TaxID=3055284 RepID=UPI002FD6FFFF